MGKIADIIKYEGDNTTFVWKHPLEDFNSMTQLIVHESQEAILFMNGKALDLFGSGRYTLETQNIPELGKMLNRATGEETPFHCEVYFTNKTEQMAVKWGTDSKIQYLEPQYQFPVSIGACGEMSLRVEDSRKLLLKLVGTENYLSQSRLVDYFRAVLMTKIKSYIAKTMKNKAISIFEIDENLDVFSEGLRKLLQPDFSEYGVALERFFVINILKPDGESKYEEFKELHYKKYVAVAKASLEQQVDIIKAQTEAQKVVIDSQAQATKRAQEGYGYIDERGFDVVGDMARNEGGGSGMMNTAMELAVGIGAAGAMGNVVSSIANSTMGAMLQNGNSNQKQDNGGTDTLDEFRIKVEKLKLMKENGLLSEEEFMEQKNNLLKML